MMRKIVAVVAGLVAWTVVATVLNLLMRTTWPDYAAVEVTMSFPFAMMIARLAIGVIASIAAGLVAASVTRGFGMPEKVLAVLLLLMFIPVHYRLWDKFPLWYHLVFVGSLIPLTLAGAIWKAQSIAGKARSSTPAG